MNTAVRVTLFICIKKIIGFPLCLTQPVSLFGNNLSNFRKKNPSYVVQEEAGVYTNKIYKQQAWFVYLHLSLDDTIEQVLSLYPGCLAYNKCFTLEWEKKTIPKQQKLKRTTCDLCVFIYWEKVLLYRGKPFSF